jgi:hypothetical protein
MFSLGKSGLVLGGYPDSEPGKPVSNLKLSASASSMPPVNF